MLRQKKARGQDSEKQKQGPLDIQKSRALNVGHRFVASSQGGRGLIVRSSAFRRHTLNRLKAVLRTFTCRTRGRGRQQTMSCALRGFACAPARLSITLFNTERWRPI